MAIKFRNYVNDARFGKDYHNVCDFLMRINEKDVTTPNFLWSRWVWMISRPVDNEEQRNKIGIWEDDGKIVALATFELTFGQVFIIVDKEYRYILENIIEYAKTDLSSDGSLKIIINDKDEEFQAIAAKNGFRPTQKKQCVAKLDLENNLKYQLPDGFSITSMADDWDYRKYNSVMWRGFGSADPVDQSEEMIDWRKTMLSSPHLIRDITIAVVAPNGNYVSHCGLWHNGSETYVNIEPVATDPDHRGMGLAKAAIYEAVTRAKKLGAKTAYVVSSQQFYYNIGFRPHVTETWWELV